jgi:hypothetical protein
MKREPVESSNIRSVGYDASIERLEIEFANGNVYQYHNVPQQEYDEFMRANSQGRYFALHIRDQFKTVSIS